MHRYALPYLLNQLLMVKEPRISYIFSAECIVRWSSSMSRMTANLNDSLWRINVRPVTVLLMSNAIVSQAFSVHLIVHCSLFAVNCSVK